MQVTLDRSTHEKVRRASKKLGIPERDVVDRAVSLYLGKDGMASLQDELRAWDAVAAETMRKHGH